MPLALFDIDGTLTASNEIDSECRAQAFLDVFGFPLNTNWNAYEHVTDRGIAIQALREARGRAPTQHELSVDRTRCIELLDERMKFLDEIRGACAFIQQLRAREWRIALCTGAWGDSARLKLARAGLPTDLPLASCDDEISREAILRRGIALAGSADEIAVSFGDASWDVRAAGLLHLPFIGIGKEAETLHRSVGASERRSGSLRELRRCGHGLRRDRTRHGVAIETFATSGTRTTFS
ncbi:MAG TPA: haloacid dehalogenase-like hydrolase [Thermoanaerobaculia bacterium]|nr:haloacid dehalogenase-like hydrolase [Thermoanaerobaculia bacterium]